MINIASLVADLRREMIRKFERLPMDLFGWTRVARTSPLGTSDQVETSDTTDGQQPVRRVEPWGITGRAPKGVRAFWVRLGSSNLLFLGVARSASYGPQDVEDGETAIYCATSGTEIRLDKDGNVKITAPSGKDVIVNSGTAKVGRVGDAVDMGTWQCDGVGSSFAGMKYTAPGALSPVTIGAVTPVSISGKISAGADHFKG